MYDLSELRQESGDYPCEENDEWKNHRVASLCRLRRQAGPEHRVGRPWSGSGEFLGQSVRGTGCPRKNRHRSLRMLREHLRRYREKRQSRLSGLLHHLLRSASPLDPPDPRQNAPYRQNARSRWGRGQKGTGAGCAEKAAGGKHRQPGI